MERPQLCKQSALLRLSIRQADLWLDWPGLLSP
jgi:hypothetical protein